MGGVRILTCIILAILSLLHANFFPLRITQTSFEMSLNSFIALIIQFLLGPFLSKATLKYYQVQPKSFPVACICLLVFVVTTLVSITYALFFVYPITILGAIYRLPYSIRIICNTATGAACFISITAINNYRITRKKIKNEK